MPGQLIEMQNVSAELLRELSPDLDQDHIRRVTTAIERLLDLGIEPYLLTSALTAVIGQRLVRCICSGCKQPVTDAAALVKAVRRAGHEPHERGALEGGRRGPLPLHVLELGLQGGRGWRSSVRPRRLSPSLCPRRDPAIP